MAKRTAVATWEISAASKAKLANGWAENIPSWSICRRWRRSRSSWKDDSLGGLCLRSNLTTNRHEWTRTFSRAQRALECGGLTLLFGDAPGRALCFLGCALLRKHGTPDFENKFTANGVSFRSTLTQPPHPSATFLMYSLHAGNFVRHTACKAWLNAGGFGY